MRMQWAISPVLMAVLLAPSALAQSALTPSTQATAFLGTWVIEMTQPAAFKGRHTVTISDNNGALTANVQTGNSPPKPVTGIVKDGEMLVLIISRESPSAMRENGVPIWAVYSLTVNDDTMKAALMLEPSDTIKKGTGRRQ